MPETEQPVPIEDILAQLRTRGFEEGFQRTPLKEFIGRLASITGNMITRFQPARMEVLYNFEDVEVLESTEPYTSPVAQISILHSNSAKSGMGVFGTSVDKLLNVDGGGNPLPNMVNGQPNADLRGQSYLIGKVLHMKYTPGHPMWNRDKKAEEPREAWEVTEVLEEQVQVKATAKAASKAGPAGPASAIETALKILDGKTAQQFNNAVFKDATCKADKNLRTSIINGTFLSAMEDTGEVTKDEKGIYHTVVE